MRSVECQRKMQEAVDMARRPEAVAVMETTPKSLPTREEGITAMLTNGGLKAWLEAAAFAIPAFTTTSLLAAVLQGG